MSDKPPDLRPSVAANPEGLQAQTTASRRAGSWYVRVVETYPHHESLRGEVGLLKRVYEDGNVLVLFENGDRVCMARKYVEDLS